MLAPTHSVFGIFLTLIILAVFGVQWGLHWTINVKIEGLKIKIKARKSVFSGGVYLRQ